MCIHVQMAEPGVDGLMRFVLRGQRRRRVPSIVKTVFNSIASMMMMAKKDDIFVTYFEKTLYCNKSLVFTPLETYA